MSNTVHAEQRVTHGLLAHLVLTEAAFVADARPDIPPILVNWHHDYFLEVTMLHSSEMPEEMNLAKVRLACKHSNHIGQGLLSCEAYTSDARKKRKGYTFRRHAGICTHRL